MCVDEPEDPSRLPSPVGLSRPAGPRARAWVWPLAMALLVAVTSLAVCVYASAWLVPPYLALMALVLGPPAGLRGRPPATAPSRTEAPWLAGRAAGSRSRREGEAGAVADVAVAVADPERPVELEAATDPRASSDATADADENSGPEPSALKARRGKGRGRKAKSATTAQAGQAGATWVRIGPGKFVRADTLSPDVPPPPTSVNAGPADGPDPEGKGDVDEGEVCSTEPSFDLDHSEPQPQSLEDLGSAHAVEALPGEALAPPSDLAPTAPVTFDFEAIGPEPEAARNLVDAPRAETIREPDAETPEFLPEPSLDVAAGFNEVEEQDLPLNPVADDDGGRGTSVPVEESQDTPNPEPGRAARSAQAPVGVPETVLAWSRSWTGETARAVGAGATEAEEVGPGWWSGGTCLGPGVAAGFAPDGSYVVISRDNGTAPDAPEGASSVVLSAVGLVTPDLETVPVPDPGPDLAADRDAPSSDPYLSVSPSPAFVPAPEPVPEPCPVVPCDESVRHTPESSAARRSGSVFRSLGRFLRGPARRNASAATAAGFGRAAVLTGNVRRGRPLRLPASRLHPRRARNAGRFRRVDRSHPPRSPPLVRLSRS